MTNKQTNKSQADWIVKLTCQMRSRCEICIHWKITMTLEWLRCWKETAPWFPGNTHTPLCSGCIEKVMEDSSSPEPMSSALQDLFIKDNFSLQTRWMYL